MSFFGTKNKSSHTLVVSLKSSSIDLQLIKTLSNGSKEVLLLVRNIILLQNSQDSALYTKEYVTELKSVLVKNSLTIKKSIGAEKLSIKFILYAPWFTSKIDSISHTGPVLIDENFLNKKLTNIVSKNNLKIVEKRVLKIQVNGYTLTEFIKVKSTKLKIDVYTSYISKKIYADFEKIILDNFQNIESINAHTSPLLFLDRIKEFMVQEDNLAVLYVGGEITELSIIKEDSLVYFATFPIGKHDFLRSIQKNIKTYDYSLLDQKSIQIKSKIQELEFKKTKEEWSKSLYFLLQNFKQHIPSKIIVVSDSKTKDFFTTILNESINQDTESLLKKHRIINFDILIFKDIISYKTPVGENEIDLIIESLT